MTATSTVYLVYAVTVILFVKVVDTRGVVETDTTGTNSERLDSR